MKLLSELSQRKVETSWLELLNKLFYKQQLMLIWDKDNYYHIYKTDMKNEIASFEMFSYPIILDDIKVNSWAFKNFTPEVKYRNRTIINLIFDLITKSATQLQVPVLLHSIDFSENTLKFSEDSLLKLNYHHKDIMELTGVKSNFEYIRVP